MLVPKISNFFANPLAGAIIFSFFATFLSSCDYGTSEYEAFEGSKIKECAAGLASFKTNIAAAIGGCSCHLGGQSPRLAKNADADNRQALLKTKKDYAYLTGGHQGASAFRNGIAENKWNAWQAEEKKCP